MITDQEILFLIGFLSSGRWNTRRLLAALYGKKENPSHKKKKDPQPWIVLSFLACSVCFSWTTFFWERD
jgi:hypothetical protein